MELADVMTPDPVVCPSSASVLDAAMLMRDQAIGDVLVERDGQLMGIVTDRDIVVRAVAEAREPSSVTLGEICTEDVHSVTIDTSVDDVVRIMNDSAVRRVPVVENGRPVGIVALGDLAVARDRETVLGNISAAAPND